VDYDHIESMDVESLGLWDGKEMGVPDPKGPRPPKRFLFTNESCVFTMKKCLFYHEKMVVLP
jgi:hypothetical protein